jgi:hypothetical protein
VVVLLGRSLSFNKLLWTVGADGTIKWTNFVVFSCFTASYPPTSSLEPLASTASFMGTS